MNRFRQRHVALALTRTTTYLPTYEDTEQTTCSMYTANLFRCQISALGLNSAKNRGGDPGHILLFRGSLGGLHDGDRKRDMNTRHPTNQTMSINSHISLRMHLLTTGQHRFRSRLARPAEGLYPAILISVQGSPPTQWLLTFLQPSQGWIAKCQMLQHLTWKLPKMDCAVWGTPSS